MSNWILHRIATIMECCVQIPPILDIYHVLSFYGSPSYRGLHTCVYYMATQNG